MMFVSDFADQAVMLPLVAVVFAGLGVIGWWRGMVAWLLAVGGTFAVILVMKAGFYAAASEYGDLYRISPSGHVAAACVVYGGLAILLLQGLAPRVVIAAVPVIAGLVIGITRLSLGMHTPLEVCIGGVFGLTGAAVLAATCGGRPRFVAWPLTMAGCVTVLALHGLHFQAEEAIQLAASNW